MPKNISTEKMIKAMQHYRVNDISIVECAKKFKCRTESLRQFLDRENAIKPQHRQKRTLAKKQGEIVKGIVESTRNIPITPEVKHSLEHLNADFDKLKGGLLENAILLNQKLNSYMKILDTGDLKQSTLLLQYAQVLKTINEAVGIFAKAPAIAIQNNIQNNSTTPERANFAKKLEIELKMPKNMPKN